jgi:hypothetical protein
VLFHQFLPTLERLQFLLPDFVLALDFYSTQFRYLKSHSACFGKRWFKTARTSAVVSKCRTRKRIATLSQPLMSITIVDKLSYTSTLSCQILRLRRVVCLFAINADMHLAAPLLISHGGPPAEAAQRLAFLPVGPK